MKQKYQLKMIIILALVVATLPVVFNLSDYMGFLYPKVIRQQAS